MDIEQELATAFEDAAYAYEVRSVESNRSQIRIIFDNNDVDEESVQDPIHSVLSVDEVLGLSVTTESGQSYDGQTTVASFRHRS